MHEGERESGAVKSEAWVRQVEMRVNTEELAVGAILEQHEQGQAGTRQVRLLAALFCEVMRLVI